jgi:topoisomerase-4 subunit A
LKPVQRRILWSLHEKDDGRFIKVATISGHCAQYHPHGEVAISDALVVVTNKRYLIEGQGNFGNIFTGDPAAAPRYIECRLTELARNEIFNDELTEFVPSYDGRNQEPVTLPAKLPVLLMLGTEGIAVGMSCRILPHNFPELLEAQIAILKKQPFKCLPDFQTGGLMDARVLPTARGSIKVARNKSQDESTLSDLGDSAHARPESLIASIEDATRKGKLKVQSVSDFTQEVEIEIKAPQGVKRGAIGRCALCIHRLRNDHLQPHYCDQGKSPGGDDGFRGPPREHHQAGQGPETGARPEGEEAAGGTPF